MIIETPDGVALDVRVIPRSRKTELAGVGDEEWIVRVAAPPVEGAANEALVRFLSETVHVPQRSIRIVRGARGRRKRVAIAGVTAAEIRALGSRATLPRAR